MTELLAVLLLGAVAWALLERGWRQDEELRPRLTAAREEMLAAAIVQLEKELMHAKSQAKDGYRQARLLQAELEN